MNLKINDGRNVGVPVPSLDALVQGIGKTEKLKG